MNVGRDGELALERAIRSGGDGDVGTAREVEHAECIRRRLLQGLVPVHRRDAEEVELGACERKEQRDRVVVTRDRNRG